MRRRLLMAGRMRYAMPLSPSLQAKFDALDAELDVHVLGSRGPATGPCDPRFTLVPPIRPRQLDGAAFYALLPWRVARVLREQRPDVVLVQGAPETALVLAGRAISRVPARVVADVHGDPASVTRLYGSSLRRLLARPGDLLARRGLRGADGVRTISGYTSEVVRRVGVEPTAVFPAFMDLAPFLERPLAPLPPVPTVLFVGVLERYKAVDVLAEAWRRVATRLPEARLHLVGRGTMADVPAELVAAQPDRVTWSPSLTTAEVSRALDEATLLVLPSRSEGLGRVIVEAFCRGRCVVGSRVGGIPDIVVDGETGLLVPPGQPDSLAGALERALVEPQLAARLGASARDAVGAWLATPEQYAHRVRALVDTVCETPRSAG